jgi:hypothetical protein
MGQVCLSSNTSTAKKKKKRMTIIKSIIWYISLIGPPLLSYKYLESIALCNVIFNMASF